MREEFKLYAFLGFVAVGAVGGWWFLGENLVSKAHAVGSGECGPGQSCKVRSLTTPTVNIELAHVGALDAGTVKAAFVDAGSISIGAAAGAPAFTLVNGAFGCLDGPACTDKIYGGTGSYGFSVTSDETSVFGTAIDVTGTVASYVASGAKAFEVTTNGARVDFGAGTSDYASSNGTTVTFAGPLSTAGALAGTTLNLGGTTLLDVLSNTATIDFASFAAGTCETQTMTVTGAATGDNVIVSGGTAAQVTGSMFRGWVSSSNTVTVQHCCALAAGSCDPASATFRATVLQF